MAEHKKRSMSNKPATLEDFGTNAVVITTLWDALDLTNLDSPIAVEIRKRLDLLVDDHARLLGMLESEIVAVNAEKQALVRQNSMSSIEETELLRLKILRIRSFIETLERGNE